MAPVNKRPFLIVKLNGRELPTDVQKVSAEIDIPADKIATATISLFDLIGDYVESILASHIGEKIEFQFGWIDDYGKRQSSYIFKGEILDYTPHFMPVGIKVEIKTVAQGGIPLMSKEKNRSFHDTPSNIVKQICRENGIECEVDDVKERGTFYQQNETDYEFILKKLLPFANQRANESPFTVNWKDNKLHFKRLPLENKPIKTFAYNATHLQHEPLISFEPEVKGSMLLGINSTGENVKAVRYDPITKQKQVFEINQKTVKNVKLDTKKVSVKAESLRPFSSETGKELTVLKNLWGKSADIPVTASAEIFGNPDIKPLSNIKVLVYIKKGQRVKLHYTSGIYQVVGVKHSISVGDFRTELRLIRNAISTANQPVSGTINRS
ncbi:Phage protein D [Balnearium lithotrophicum]|uniref:Phage protein D n=1 Tax=Balnearium lithotrophicum TaxID=223788 RepID=A0A521CIU9_9BACT|nr:hypothetical protein [Balnearium lithotrophicum]SMO59312.1 Phage protein D [Balnearium lithotrophicum]